MIFKVAARVLATSALAMLGLSQASAEPTLSNRPIKIVVPFPAGGSIDTVSRIIAEKLNQKLNVSVIVDNRAGATGLIGAQAVVNAPADGHTVLLTTSAITISPWLTNSPFDNNSLKPVTRIANASYVLVVNNNGKFKNLQDFIDYAKNNPDQLTCSTYGIGSPPHLALELFKREAGIRILHVPYRGFTFALPDLASGRIDCSMHTEVDTEPHVKKGTLLALANTSAGFLRSFPEAEPLASTWPDTEVTGWQGIFVPKNTPDNIVKQLNETFSSIIKDPEMVEKLRTLGFEAVTDTPTDFNQIYRNEYQRFGALLKEINLQPN